MNFFQSSSWKNAYAAAASPITMGALRFSTLGAGRERGRGETADVSWLFLRLKTEMAREREGGRRGEEGMGMGATSLACCCLPCPSPPLPFLPCRPRRLNPNAPSCRLWGFSPLCRGRMTRGGQVERRRAGGNHVESKNWPFICPFSKSLVERH